MSSELAELRVELEFYRKYGRLNHLPTCNRLKQHLWDEAQQALNGIPMQDRDVAFYTAQHELSVKREECTCGLWEQAKKFGSVDWASI